GTLAEPETKGTPQRTSRTNPVQAVQVPDADQHSQSLVGLVPVTPQLQDGKSGQARGGKQNPKPWMKALMVMVSILAIFAAIGILFVGRTKSPTPTTTISTPAGPPDITATTIAQLTATAQANIILSDP